MKAFAVTAFFPEVKPAHAAFQSCVSTAAQMSTAISRGLYEMRERPGLKGKRIHEVRLTVKEIDPSGILKKENHHV